MASIAMLNNQRVLVMTRHEWQFESTESTEQKGKLGKDGSWIPSHPKKSSPMTRRHWRARPVMAMHSDTWATPLGKPVQSVPAPHLERPVQRPKQLMTHWLSLPSIIFGVKSFLDRSHSLPGSANTNKPQTWFVVTSGYLLWQSNMSMQNIQFFRAAQI